jgi:hypothetical protein
MRRANRNDLERLKATLEGAGADSEMARFDALRVEAAT